MKKFILAIAAMCVVMLCNSQETKWAPPVMGWSSWNTYRVHISDSLIMRQADALVATGLRDAGYSYINIDDGFFGWRDSLGVLHENAARFPGGMCPVVDHIHSLGLKAGIYSDAGTNTCGSIWDADEAGVGSGLYGHELMDADLFFNKWKFDYIKIDFCGGAQDLELDEQERYTHIRQAISQVCPRRISLNLCRWAFPGTWAAEVADSWRISGDISASWQSVKHIISKNLYLSAFARNGHYNDMDMLEIGRGLSDDEEATHFAMWCAMSSPLLIGCNLTKIPSSSLNLLLNPELIAINQDPLGLQAYVAHRSQQGGYVLVKDVEQLRGPRRVAVFYNPTDSAISISVPLSALEMGGKVKVRNLLTRTNLDAVTNTITQTVNPHGVSVLMLTAGQRLEPQLYEAECAYLPCYNDLGKQRKPVAHAAMEGASGGMVVTRLGGTSRNVAVWDNVYSRKGGKYSITVSYVPQKNACLEVNVNGDNVQNISSNNEEFGTLQHSTFEITLKPGYNTITMGSPFTWACDVDCFTLKPL
ncbi:MAG: alpha-galactosidase D [Muribaculaceae bacterium]